MGYNDNLKEIGFSVFICEDKFSVTHSHYFLELAYVLKGEAEHFLDKKCMVIKEGDYFVVDYGSKHSYRAISDELEIINCLFMPELIDASLAGCTSLEKVISNYQIHFKNEFFISNPSQTVYFDDDGKIKKLLLGTLDEFTSENPGYLQVIRSKLIEILVLTMRKIYFNVNQKEKDSAIDGILKYISENYAGEISLKDISSKFGYSTPYLSAKLKKELGVTFKAYLQKTRIEQSMRLLAHTDKTICEVAQSVGYHDIKAFYEIFKRVSGSTPGVFKKNNDLP